MEQVSEVRVLGPSTRDEPMLGSTGNRSAVVLSGASRALSDRELRSLALIACGLSDTEIAHQLGASLSAGRYAIRSALSKLGALNRAHAVARAGALGLLEFRATP